MSEEDKKPYCGYKEKMRKNQRRGTMTECTKLGKISYFGKKLIDSRTVEMLEKKVNLTKEIEKTKIKLVGLKSQIKKLTADIKREKDKKKKNELQKELTTKEDTFKTLLRTFNDLKNKKVSKKKPIKIKEPPKKRGRPKKQK